MDQTNREIVSILLRDGRASYAEIGDAVGLSATAVKRRVDRMQARGEISGFTVRVAPEELGWGIEAYVEIFCRGNISPAALERDFGPIPEVVRVDTVTGEADALVQIMAGSMSDVERIVESFRVNARVDKTRTAIVMSRVIDRPARLD
ncbi:MULTISPECIES: Lrp/AsnC family transcriptional regulator [unclassified Isoptericola]|uniref:Lrp/AsnC family transcriptional regulator n=1 Tax=unclassified Isoptericola TaxID=2623355 RepID=UPI002712CEB9|nr:MULTISPECIES: Lrp/AsnC family transcriptional regulator [unclassified Isoptericola]MDO8145824.1 Lrp/AsnC family transcriptional regulator [Isoptericola sp. 178]MDO8149906.1 Lrp/AsnC family transcriptional regulator [Isoptericola sp. b408]